MLGIYIIVKSDLDVLADVGEGDEGGRDKAQNTNSPAEQSVVLADLFQPLLEPPVRVQVRMNSAHDQGRSLRESFLQCRIGRIAQPDTKRFKVKYAARELCRRSPTQSLFRTGVRNPRRAQQPLQHLDPAQTVLRRLNLGRISRVNKSVSYCSHPRSLLRSSDAFHPAPPLICKSGWILSAPNPFVCPLANRPPAA